MVQLYFLSVVFNALIGFLLIIGNLAGGKSTDKLSFSLGGFRLIIGILAAITGFLKFVSPFESSVYIIGDLLPALAGIIGGFTLIFSFYRENSSKNNDEGNLDHIGDTFLRYKKAMGIVFIVIAALHFLFPRALFL